VVDKGPNQSRRTEKNIRMCKVLPNAPELAKRMDQVHLIHWYNERGV
jgi:hypothetical protein